MSFLALLLSLAAEAPQLWIGHQIVRGRREVPVLGTLETRTDTWVLAEVHRTDAQTIEIRERPCRVRVAPAAGAHVTIPDAAVWQLPPVSVRYKSSASGWLAAPWVAGWDGRDHDKDGHPGLTIAVDAPLCGGQLHVASAARSIARAQMVNGALAGEIKVRLAQRILGTEGVCLGVLASDSDERLTGRFAYAPVPAESTCASLERDGWLDRPLP